MAKTKAKPTIKAIIGFNKVPPPIVYARATAILNGVYTNPNDYPNPPIAAADFKADVDAFSAKITASLDGGKKAIAERNHQGEVVIKALRHLGHYVEAACRDDMPTFLKSGFQAVPVVKATAQALSLFIRQIKQGSNSGQFKVTLVAVPAASAYELRWAAIGAGGTLGAWTTQPITKTRPSTSVTGLTPGTNYALQVRSLGDSGWSDWSDSVTRISM